MKSSIPGLSEEPNHCALSAFRTYLLLSYLALILLLTAGVLAIAGHFVGLLLGLSLETAETAVNRITAANVRVSDDILTSVGEYRSKFGGKSIC